MSILSTNKKLINIGKEYSAGSGIDITDQVISVIGNTVPYSAGENIDIQDFVISGKDWSNDITDASANAFNETTAWVHDNYTNSADVSFLSAEVDKKLDSSAWEAVSGSLATEDYVILSDNLTYARATAFTTSQGYAKESACNSAFDYLNENKLDSSAFDLPNSGHWNEATNVVETNSGSWSTVSDKLDATAFTNWQDGQYATDLQTIEGQISNKLDTTAFSEVSGDFQPRGDYAERDFVLSSIESANSGKLDVSSFASVSSDFLVASSLDGYATESFVENVSGDITALIPTDYATTTQVNELSGAVDYISANAGDQEVNNIVHTNSATWDSVTNKLDTTAFSTVSGNFLTTSFGISESAHWEEATNAYEQASGTYLTSHQDLSDYQTIEGMTAYQPVGEYYSASNPSGFITGVDLTPYYTTAEANTLSSMLSASIDYVSANAGDEFPASANEAITAYQNASGTYLTAISIPDSATWNDVSTTVQTNSATWGQGGGVPQSAFDELKLSYDSLSSLFATYSGQWLLPNEPAVQYVLSSITANVEINDGSWDHGGDVGFSIPQEVSAFTQGLEQGKLSAIFNLTQSPGKSDDKVRYSYNKYNIPDDDFCGTWVANGSTAVTAVLSGFGANSAAPTGYPVYMGFPYIYRDAGMYNPVTFSGYVPVQQGV